MMCRACGLRPPRPKPLRGRGPAPWLCDVCATERGRPVNLARERAQVAAVEARQRAGLAIPHAAPCTCAGLIVRVEGPLLVCGICSREIAGQGVED